MEQFFIPMIDRLMSMNIEHITYEPYIYIRIDFDSFQSKNIMEYVFVFLPIE